ncbi:sugar diacid recognition domain-containing protein [Neobacillus sp. PS3-34]|uniref:sugar diacid recognition domain-containing protein n=1 Tax=Neobacillus sp. PS3-34 TaxID=3070678 RepID=UPI0027DEBF82|nr:sugar diacid recognition domain-containing protein [Neobacillus sp. PS3-34]WML46945.1 sugar diacid recognition domain-containing protein [Neobacillus sp. PS3-34]
MKFLNKQLAQEIVDRTMAIIGHNINVMNDKGVIIGSGDIERIDDFHEGALLVIDTKEGIEVNEQNRGMLHGVKPGINLPITFEKEVVGVVGITGPPDEIRSFGELIKMTAEIILQQAVLMDQVRWDERLKEEIVSQMIHAEVKPDALFFERAKRISIDIHIPRVALLIKSTDCLAVLNLIKDSFDQNDLFLMQSDAVLILKKIHLKNELWNREETLHTAVKWLKLLQKMKEPARIGIGDYQAGLVGISKSYFQARATAEVGIKLDPLKLIYLFEDYRLPVFLLDAAQNGIEQKLTPYYAEITKHDKKGELIETLQAYIEENGEINTVSQKLFIHRNTLRYRLDRITEITGKDPRKVKDLLDLYLALLYSKIH